MMFWSNSNQQQVTFLWSCPTEHVHNCNCLNFNLPTSSYSSVSDPIYTICCSESCCSGVCSCNIQLCKYWSDSAQLTINSYQDINNHQQSTTCQLRFLGRPSMRNCLLQGTRYIEILCRHMHILFFVGCVLSKKRDVDCHGYQWKWISVTGWSYQGM